MANPVEASINAYLIEGDGRVALVDTGAGAFFGPGAGGKLLASLRMVFPNANIHVGQRDVDFFLAAANQKGVNGYDKAYFEQATKSMQPYVKAGKVKGFLSAIEIMPGLKAVPTPGHTPGHAFYVLASKGESLEFIGDVLHV